MNEEELKKGCGKRQGRGLNFYICGHLLLNVLCPTCKARLEGFQKGKLEQKKEDIKLIKGFEPTKSNMMYDEVCSELIKQIKGKEEK